MLPLEPLLSITGCQDDIGFSKSIAPEPSLILRRREPWVCRQRGDADGPKPGLGGRVLTQKRITIHYPANFN